MSEKGPSYNPAAENQDLSKEREFHDERFANMAKKYKHPSLWEQIRKPHDLVMRPIDFAHEEALQDNADFEKRQSEEYKEWQKHLEIVIEHLKAKTDDPEGAGKNIRPLLLILGGGLRGPYGAGQVIGFNELGIEPSTFSQIVGASTGAGIATYYIGGREQTFKGTSIYYEECLTPEFLDVNRPFHTKGGVKKRLSEPLMNSKVAGRVMREGAKAIDEQVIRDCPAEYYVAVTNQRGKQAELINVKTAKPDMVSAIEASMNVPLWNAPGIEVNDEKYIDGSFDPLPIQEVVNKFKPTDVLILPNVPFNTLATFKSSPAEWFFGHILPKSGSVGTLKKFLKLSQNLRKNLEEIKKGQNVDIGILWPPDSGLGTMTKDPGLMKTAALESARDTIRQFGGNQPEKIELYTT